MTQSEDDGLWQAEDYDDEPRSHGNFGLDPCMQMMEAEAEARQRKRMEACARPSLLVHARAPGAA